MGSYLLPNARNADCDRSIATTCTESALGSPCWEGTQPGSILTIPYI